MSSQVVLYHGTNEDNLKLIKKKGLLPSSVTNITNFHTTTPYIFFLKEAFIAYNYGIVSALVKSDYEIRLKVKPVLLKITISKRRYDEGRKTAKVRKKTAVLSMDTEVLLKFISPRKISVIKDKMEIKKLCDKLIEFHTDKRHRSNFFLEIVKKLSADLNKVKPNGM